jgi:hypothetical protein
MQKKSLIPATWTVPEIFRERLGRRIGRQRMMVEDGHLLLVLHAPPLPDEEDRDGCLFWRNPEGEWRSSEHGAGASSLGKHLASFEDAIDKLDQLEEGSEGIALRSAKDHQHRGAGFVGRADDYFVLLDSLLPLHRTTSHLHQVLQEARKAIPQDRDLINSRDLAYELERHSQLLYTSAKNALEFDIARRTEEHARASHQMATSAHRLNVLAGFFFPIATLSALFGVNLLHGYEQKPGPGPFFTLVAAGLVAGLCLTMFLRKPATKPE